MTDSTFPTSDLAQNAARLIMRWKASPQAYIKECLGINDIWRLQNNLLTAIPKAIAERKAIYIASGHALGKDYICGAVSNWFLDCWGPCKVTLTAPSDRQVKRIMWAETLSQFNAKEARNMKLWGKAFTDPYIEIRKTDWYLQGFATKDTGAAAEAGGGRFQGMRAAVNMCIIVTEAQAIEDPIFDQIDAVATAQNCLVIFLGNPTRAKGRFAKGLRDKVNNIVFHFSCLDNPNYQQRKIVIPGLATYEWVEDKRRRWGESDPRWIGRVLGRIPEGGLNNTFPESWMNICKERHGFLAQYISSAGVSVDSAGEGVDDNVIMSGKGGEVMDVYTKTLMTPNEIAHKAVEMCRAVDGHFIVFDADGLGIRDYQQAAALPKDYLRGIRLVKFHGSAPSQQTVAMPDGKRKKIYCNVRAEASFVTREQGLAGKCSINEKDKELIDDLMEEEYFENDRGEIQIEDKADIRERLERSPGRGDAYKMLQWGFFQNFKDKTYADTRANRRPEYGKMDSDIDITSPGHSRDRQTLPAYGRME